MIETKSIREIAVQKILPCTFKLRSLDETNVRELMNSIKANGLLQPILVKPFDRGLFRIVFGSHRFDAVRRLGWKTVPANVRNVSDEEGFLMNVTENLQRNAYMSPVAEAKGYKYLIDRKWTMREIAIKIGKSDSYVCNRLRVLKRLHPDIQRQLEFPRGNSSMSASHAEHLSLIDDPRRQLELATLIKEQNLSVRQVEKLTRGETRATPTGCLCIKCPSYACKLYELHSGN